MLAFPVEPGWRFDVSRSGQLHLVASFPAKWHVSGQQAVNRRCTSSISMSLSDKRTHKGCAAWEWATWLSSGTGNGQALTQSKQPEEPSAWSAGSSAAHPICHLLGIIAINLRPAPSDCSSSNPLYSNKLHAAATFVVPIYFFPFQGSLPELGHDKLAAGPCDIK